MAIDWDALYELAPSDTTYVKDTDDAIRSLKTATRERFTKEHEFDLASQVRQGLHRAGSAVAFYQSSAPTQRNGVDLGAADAGILFIDSDDKNIKAWDGDSFENVKPAVAVLADSATNADTVDSYHAGLNAVEGSLLASHGYYHNASGTFGAVFSALNAVIPNTGDWVPISGGYTIAAFFSVSRIERTNSTTMTLYGAGPSSIGTVAFTAADAVAYKISLAW